MKDEVVSLSWPLVDFSSRKHGRMPPLYFDIGFDPRIDVWNVRANRGGYSTPLSREEQQIAVSPHCELTEMTIVCSSEYLAQWPVTVRRKEGLRCIDVFRAIHDTYAVRLTRAELAYIGESYIKRCERAFKQRCADSPGLGAVNELAGLRRVDLLRGRRIFKGITRTPGPDATWVLHFDTPYFDKPRH